MRSLFAGAVVVGALASSSYAADLPVKAAPAPVIATYNWTGWYAGVNAGYSWGSSTNPTITCSDPGDGFCPFVASGGFNTASLNPKGALGGAQAGYNFQSSRWVYGFEADIQADGISASATNSAALFGIATTSTVEHKLQWFGTVRGRVGVAADNWLFYGTGGLIYGGVKSSLTQTANNGYAVSNSVTNTRAGWTIGAGTEWAFAGRWSAKLEYLYYDMGRDTVTTAGTGGFTGDVYSVSQRTAGQLLRAGLNYKF